MSRYKLFDRSRIRLRDIVERGHQLIWNDCLELAAPKEEFEHPDFDRLVGRIISARRESKHVVLMMGAHPIKLGLSRFVIDLVRRGIITHIATNGAGAIHDFELALVGGTSEDVRKWISVGQFGLWKQSSGLNEIASCAAARGEGLGEALGRVVLEQAFPYCELSIAAAGFSADIPFTTHVSIGSDIISAMPNCDGAAIGSSSYTDFLILAQTFLDLEGGVFLNVGTAVTGPEVYLKALSMARNVAMQAGNRIDRFTTAVFDLVPLPRDFKKLVPSTNDPLYYYRPWKTVLCRTIEEEGASFYFCGDHRVTIPALWQRIVSIMATENWLVSDQADHM